MRDGTQDRSFSNIHIIMQNWHWLVFSNRLVYYLVWDFIRCLKTDMVFIWCNRLYGEIHWSLVAHVWLCDWQVMHCDCVKAQEADSSDCMSFSPSSPREKWLRRRTHVKLRVSGTTVSLTKTRSEVTADINTECV